ncbi:MAG: helix-turn-helix domain-containing protein [Chloroflexi bacterium]|nr:helix-turn-helix domain-containing protein [Chloroflexota bacterium]
MSKSKKTDSGKLKISEYIETRMRDMSFSLRDAAQRIGISPSYLSKIVTGKQIPEAQVCADIADAFGDPRVKILRYAGWLEDDETAMFAELEQLAKKDAQFQELVEMYRKLDSKKEKEMLLKMVKAALTK